MDLSLFIQSLSYNEKKDLLKLLEENLEAPEVETLWNFLERINQDDKLPTRLRTMHGIA